MKKNNLGSQKIKGSKRGLIILAAALVLVFALGISLSFPYYGAQENAKSEVTKNWKNRLDQPKPDGSDDWDPIIYYEEQKVFVWVEYITVKIPIIKGWKKRSISFVATT